MAARVPAGSRHHLQRWVEWVAGQGGMDRHPLAAAYASMLAATIGRPAEAARWADAADRLLAAELFVSPNTIKSQAYSMFRKLGASSRSQAVARSRELALLEG